MVNQKETEEATVVELVLLAGFVIQEENVKKMMLVM
jgi:hypothetical protein